MSLKIGSGKLPDVEIANAAALAAENERLMSQALLHNEGDRRMTLNQEEADQVAELVGDGEMREEAELEIQDADEAELEKNASDLEHEREEMLEATGFRRVLLVLQYYARLTVLSDLFNYFIILVIIIAGINVGVQTYSADPLLTVLDNVILVCFSVEVILKVMAEGYQPWKYWTGKEWKWNNFDFTIVFMSLPFWGGLFGSGSLALLRLVRLMRLGKLIKKIPALQMIVQGLTGGLSSIGYILVLLFLVYYLFAVVGFYFFGENDPFHFGNIPMAMITLFRCSTLDSWSSIMNLNIFGCSNYANTYVDPSEYPDVPSLLLCTNPTAQLGFSAAYFVIFIVISAMVMLSLFIGTVTMSMNQSMENLRLLSEKKRKKEAFLKNKAIITAKIVEDAATSGNIKSRPSGSVKSRSLKTESAESVPLPSSPGGLVHASISADGSLSSEQSILLSSHRVEHVDPLRDQGPNAAVHRAMYVQSVLDHQQEEDPEGRPIGGPFAFVNRLRFSSKAIFMTDKSAEEVIERQEKTKRYLLMAMGEDVTESASEEVSRGFSLATMYYLTFCNFCRRFAEDGMFINFVTFIIVLAGIVVGFQTDPRALAVKELADALNVLNSIILAVFTLECILKIFAEGLTPLKYFKDGWNKFDFIIVVGSYVPGAGSLLVILRLLRLLRVLKLVRSLPQLAVILSAMMLGLSSIGYIALILFLVFYVFAILGMILFAVNDPWNFGSLHMAMLTLFRIVTLDEWHNILYINMFGCDSFGLYNGIYADYPQYCKQPQALGPIAVIYFILFVIIGAQVLLTLFIGVVTTSMDQASEAKKALLKLEERVVFIQNKFGLTDNQILNFRKCFALLDLDNGGTIEEEELKIGLTIVDSKMSDEEITSRMKAADPSVEGVDLVGFISFMSNLPKFKQKRMFVKVLKLYREHRKKKIEASRRAKYFESMNRLGEILVSPRSLISPRSKDTNDVKPVSHEDSVDVTKTHNDASLSNKTKNIPIVAANDIQNKAKVLEMTPQGKTEADEKMVMESASSALDP